MVPDDALKAKLAQLPPEAEHFWYGPHGEVRIANPNEATLPSGAPRKRKRAELKKEPHPSYYHSMPTRVTQLREPFHSHGLGPRLRCEEALGLGTPCLVSRTKHAEMFEYNTL